MKHTQLGNSDLTIAPVVLGTWAIGGWLWGGTDNNKSEEAILASIDAGINCIDTAPAYGFGLSEEIVGKAIKLRKQDNLVIATKCGLVWEDTPGSTFFFDTEDNSGAPIKMNKCLKKESIIQECENSLRRLGVDAIDLYQCHWPHNETPISESIEALTALREQGKIKAFGVSNYSAEELEQCVSNGGVASNQPKYSLLSREVEDEILPCCLKNNIGVIAYSSMEMGILTGKITIDHEFADTDTRNIRPWFQRGKRQEVLTALDLMKPIADKHDATLGQISVAWIFSQPGVTAAIVGARNPDQAKSNAAAAQIELDTEDIQSIRAIFEPLTLDEPFDVSRAKR